MKFLTRTCVVVIVISILLLVGTLFYRFHNPTIPNHYVFYGVHYRGGGEPVYMLHDTLYGLKQALPYDDCLQLMTESSSPVSMESAPDVYERGSLWVFAADDQGFYIEDPDTDLRCYV